MDRAVRASAAVRDVTQALADETARACGLSVRVVPDLGPTVLIDQLRVMTYDAQQAGLDPDDIARRLTDLRRAIS